MSSAAAAQVANMVASIAARGNILRMSRPYWHISRKIILSQRVPRSYMLSAKHDEVCVVKLEFRRLTGKPMLDDRPWRAEGIPASDLKEHAKAALMGFYANDQHEFWPKEQFRDKAPEEVRIVDAAGNVVARYDIRDIIAETNRQLVGIKSA
jgi:hypothetical protein